MAAAEIPLPSSAAGGTGNAGRIAEQIRRVAPSPCSDPVCPIRPAEHADRIKLFATSSSGGAVGFRSGTTGAFSETLTVSVPTNGMSIPFFVAGKFDQPNAFASLRGTQARGSTGTTACCESTGDLDVLRKHLRAE